MSNKRVAFISFLILAVIIALSSVSASDLTYDHVSNASNDNAILSTPITDIQEDDIYYSDSEILSSEADTPLEASKSSTKGTFTELQKKINSAKKGSTIYLTKDYYYNKDFGTLNGIKITKPITIDGKGHAIDGKGKSALLLILKTNNVVLKNIVFRNGEIDDVGTVGVFYSNNVKFTKCQFDKNYAENGGAVVLAYSDSSSFDSCKFKRNMAEYNGGAVYLDHSSSTFKSCTFNDNGGDCGGAIYLDYSSSTFKSCTFNDNVVYGYTGGGAVYLDHSSSTFNSCNFKSNFLYEGDGGALYLNHSSASIKYCKFNENMADCGGAIYSIQSVLTILNADFRENEVFFAGGDIFSQYSMIFLEKFSSYKSNSYGFGGSLSLNNDYLHLTNCNFKECESLKDGGGAIYSLNSIIDSYSSQFRMCNAYYGGAICSLNTDLVIKNNVFENNTAYYTGGSIHTLYGTLTIDNSNFLYSKGTRGGAMYIRNPHKINNITNNRFLYCSAHKGPITYIDNYYDEIPENGNIYEEIYFVIGNFTYDLNNKKYSNFSNILTYVISNSNEYQHDLSFYNNLKNYFISNIDFIPNNNPNNHFNIIDEHNQNNSTIFLNYYNNSNSSILYDVGHFNNEFNSSTNLELYFCNLEGNTLMDLYVFPYIGNTSGLNSSMHHIIYFSNYYSYESGLIYPNSDDEKNVTPFDNTGNNPDIWVCSSTPDEFYHYKIKGNFSINIEDKTFHNLGNIYEFIKSYNPTPLINYNYSEMGNFPSKYDSRDVYFVTPVKNQGIGNNCWAFAGIATLEACFAKTTGIPSDFSENNAKNVMAASSLYGLNLDTNAGGYDTMFISYLTSWLGPVPNGKDIYNPLSSLSMELKTSLHIQDVPFLHPRQNSYDNDEIKYAIMNYGAVCVIFNWTEEDNPMGFHSVTLIGWDDDYDDYDSLCNYAEGAWIFKNSWGDEWEDDGFGYLSYQQKLSGEIAPYMHAYSFKFNDGYVGYQEIYQYDFAGLTDYINTDTDYIYYKNKFTAKDNEILLAFSTYFEKETNFTFSVRVNGKDIDKTEDNTTIVNVIHNCPAGYHTIPLGYNLTLNKGDEFEIIIKLINDGTGNFIPVCQADELYKASFPNNVSYFSYDGNDWIDLYDLNSENKFVYGGVKNNTSQISCIKAFTARKSGSMETGHYTNPIEAINKTYVFYELNAYTLPEQKKIIIDVADWDLDNEYYGNLIELRNDDDIHYLIVKKGRVYLNINDKLDHLCSAKLVSNYFTSNLIKFYYSENDLYFGTFSELKGIIDNATEDSTIHLDKNYYFDDNLINEHILINKSLTIDGEGHILNGAFKSCIFEISPNCNVILKNITFKNGKFINGGSIYSNGNLNISYCTFYNNHADSGGAIYSNGECFIENSTFYSNHATYGDTIRSINRLHIINSNFKSDDKNTHIIHFSYYYDHNNTAHGDLYLKNNKMVMSSKNTAAIFYDEDKIAYPSDLYLVFNDISIIKGEYGNICQLKNDDGNTIRIKDINLTLTDKDNSKKKNFKITYNNTLGYALNTNSIDYGTYQLSGNMIDYPHNYTITNGTLYIVKKSILKAPNLTKVYGKNNKLTVTLKEENGKAISNAYVYVKLNGKTTKIKTNSKGQATLSFKLVPKTYTAVISYKGSEKYSAASTKVKIIIKKATPKIIASKKTFSKKTKTKKYTITLKNNLGKIMKNKKVTLKVKGKTYSVKTDNNGKATFKLKLTYKGEFTGLIKYDGNKYYNAVSKKVAITVK